MNDENAFKRYFPLIHKIANCPDIYYECQHNPNVMRIELDIFVLSVNGLTYWDFEASLNEELKKGISQINTDICELQKDEAKGLINELKNDLRDCHRLLYRDKTIFEEYPYFSKAYFDDKKGNLIYLAKMRNEPLTHLSITTYSYKLEGAPIEKVDHRYLHINTSPYAKLYVSVLESLNDRLDDVNMDLHYASKISEEDNGKYELILINKHTSKELTYLFNLLYRIRFYELREGDYENLYRLIGSIYKSKRHPKGDKARTVKNDWNSSKEHEIDELFIQKFIKNVLDKLAFLANEDMKRGYEPNKLSKMQASEI